MAIYMQYGPKDKMKGNVSAEGHENWIECSSVQFGVGRAIPMMVGKQTNREASNPSLSEVTLTKTMDDSSPYLFQESLKGKGETVTIHVTKTGQEKIEEIVEYKLDQVLLSGYSVSSGGDRPSESISLSYTKIEMKYIVWGEDHTKTTQIPVSYDLGSAKSG
jgi:type VI secretion system secreted protein Hcp